MQGALKKKITDAQFWLAVLIFGENHAKKHPVAQYVAPHGGGKGTFSRFPFRYSKFGGLPKKHPVCCFAPPCGGKGHI